MLEDPIAQATQVLGGSTPTALHLLQDGTSFTPRWRRAPYDELRPATQGHLAAIIHRHGGEVCGRSGYLGQRAPIGARTLVLVPEGHDGEWSAQTSIEFSLVFLTAERLQRCAEAIPGGRTFELLDRVGYDDPIAGQLIDILSRKALTAESASRLFIDQAMDLLCTQLVTQHSSLGKPVSAMRRRGLAAWQVKRVTAYMRDNLDEAIGLDELAAQVRLSRFHFCTAFRLATGYTPHEWLTAERIRRARALLVDQALRITDVALAVGYQTPSAFTASFRRLTGVTPSEFRRRL